VPVFAQYQALLARQAHELSYSYEELAEILMLVYSLANLHNIYFLWRPSLKRTARKRLRELLAKAADVPPLPGDELPADLAAKLAKKKSCPKTQTPGNPLT